MAAMTFEQAMALTREENAKYLAKIEADKAEREASDAKYKAEREAADAKFYAALEADRLKWEKKEKQRDKHWNQVFQTLGSVRRTISELIELVIMPKVIKTINKHGHKFSIVSANKYFYRPNGNMMAEVDLMLANCDETFILEIKSSFGESDIEEHRKRLVTLRKHEDITDMKNKVMYAGIAGISITPAIRKLAHSYGMYVLTIREEEERIVVSPPKKKTTW